MTKTRTEAFSDGVFAIVITLLILEIRVPEVEYSQLGQVLPELLPRIFAYVISFGVIGTYWVAHHYSFLLVGRMNGFLLCLNMLFLLFVSFMPFPTALLGRYPMQAIPILIYGVNLIAANITGLVLILYLRSHPELTSAYARAHPRNSISFYVFVNGSYLIAMLMGFFIPLLSYCIYSGVLAVVIGFYARNSPSMDASHDTA